jgi:phosphatidylglycerophosphate synthase
MDINSRRRPADSLNVSAGITQLVGLLAVVCLAWTACAALRLSELYPLKAEAFFAIVVVFTLVLLHDNHPFARYGPANQITTLRAVLVALVAGLIGEPRLPVVGVWAVGLSVIIAMLDGIDGWLARRSRMASAFGARFDMEIDAALIMALAILAWRHDKAGAWVVLSGLLRYFFVAAGWRWQWLQRPLPPVRRRQAICVVQILALIVVMIPAVTPPGSTVLSAVALGALCCSFLVDILWLWRQHRIHPTGDEPIEGGRRRGQHRHDWRGSVGLATAVVFLDVAVTFSNIWPTPAIRWQGELSVELASFLLLLVIATRWLGPPSRAALAWLSVLWVLLVIGRYVDVTAPALYGRDINLYWDLRYVPDVVSMLVRAAPALGFLVAASAVLIVYVMFVLVRSAMRRLGTAMLDARERRVLGALAAVVIMLFAGEQLTGRLPVAFGNPVLTTFARQVPLVIGAVAGSASLDPSPPMDSDLALVKGADVLLVFLESYGAVSYDQPAFNRLLTPSRGQLEAAIRATGRDVVSTYVESPTFGGNSWLAHLSLLSGVEVRDPNTNAALMTQKRDTLVTAFSRHGYRTVAVMPGLWQRWPEGAFYGFDDIYGGERLDYHGPQFGWWSMSDQFAFAKVDALEVYPAPRAPLFLFFPTISTHTPFTPIPPYQPDWRRMLEDRPYEAADLKHAWDDDEPDWMNLGPSYVAAVEYAYRVLAGYIRMRADRDFVLILIGDHQPPAAVSGLHARWDVPMHVIASRPEVLERLRHRGFQSGLRPSGPALVRMHAMLPILLEVFGSRR